MLKYLNENAVKSATILCILLMFASCSSVHFHSNEVREYEPRQGVIITPLLADYEMLSTKAVIDSMSFDISDMGTGDYINPVGGYINLKNELMAKMMKQYDADAMISTLTDVVMESGNYAKVIIRGYPVRYKNFRNVTPNDAWMIQFFNVIDRNTEGRPDHNLIVNPNSNTNEKGGK
jgi:hypothetical protein